MQFISEPITPDAGAFDTALMAIGLASPPRAFTWRDKRYVVEQVISHVKQSGVESFSGERYLRRQQFEVLLDTGHTAVIYVERQARRANSRARWFLYTISAEPPDEPGTLSV